MGLEFYWKFNDYALIAAPKGLARFSDGEENETVDFVKYYNNGINNYSIGYFYWSDSEDCWEFKFVGDRFLEITSDDIGPIFEMLKSAYRVLSEWKSNKNLND